MATKSQTSRVAVRPILPPLLHRPALIFGLTHAHEPVLAVSSLQRAGQPCAFLSWAGQPSSTVSNGVPASLRDFLLRHGWRSNVRVGRAGHESSEMRRILDHALPERTPHQHQNPLVPRSSRLALLRTPAACFGGYVDQCG